MEINDPDLSSRNIKKSSYYVYVLRDPYTRKIFYVGKGSKRRVYSHSESVLKGKPLHNNMLESKIRSIFKRGSYPVEEIVYENLSEFESFARERELIADIGLKNLCNIKAEGCYSSIHYIKEPTKNECRKTSKRKSNL